MTIEEAAASTGRAVVYDPTGGHRERGVIASTNSRFVFVRYGLDLTARATDPEDLTLEFADARLEAVTMALRERPLEDRVPGYGGAGLSAWDKAEILAYLNDED